MPKRAKSTKRARNEALIKGILAHPELFVRGIGDEMLTGDELVAHLETQNRMLADIDRYDAMKSEAILREADMEKETLKLWRAIRWRVAGILGEGSTDVLDFGMKPKKKPKIPVVTKAIAVAKRRATRKERRTMGKRQKKNIKGT